MTAAAELAQRLATPLGEREQLRSGEPVDLHGIEQLDSQCHIPCRASTRLLDIEPPAHQLESRWASAHLAQQLTKSQKRAIASSGGARMFGDCGHVV
jgi:hypothetical protein